jgi:SAM-dependent methyltransferase
MPLDQGQIFTRSEGDQWFKRNKSTLDRLDPETDLPLKIIELNRLQPRSVLEVGAANGFRLAAISERYGAKAVAVEPSADAVNDGKVKFPSVQFVRGEISAIPLRQSFDLVIINFVFHWVDRTRLLRSIAEIDRVLENGGFLIISDFYPSYPTKVRYHHLPESSDVFTYKQNYSEPFLASGLYQLVHLLTADHSSKVFGGSVPKYERIGAWLLRKAMTEHYV